MSQLNESALRALPDFVYFDLTTSNFNSSSTPPQPFYYAESRNIPFLQSPEQYDLTILRATAGTSLLPAFIPSIQINQDDPDLTIYSVTLSYAYNGTVFDAQAYVEWAPQDLSIPKPPPPSKTSTKSQSNASGYYETTSLSFWTYRVYQALVSAFDELTAEVTAAGGTLPSNYAPIFAWDSSSNSAYVLADTAGYDLSDTSHPQIKLFFNPALYALFSSFPVLNFGYAVPHGKSFQIVIADNGGTNAQEITKPNFLDERGSPVVWTALATYQEFSTISSMCPITALCFTSGTLPVYPCQVSTPLIYNNGAQLGFEGGNSAVVNLITDIVSNEGVYSPNLVYLPTAVPRMISMLGNSPLSNFDLSIFYRLKSGEMLPHRLASGEAVTMKICFIKKGATKFK